MNIQLLWGSMEMVLLHFSTLPMFKWKMKLERQCVNPYLKITTKFQYLF